MTDHSPETLNLTVVGHADIGRCMHINVTDGYAYVGHMETGGTSVVDVRDPRAPRHVTTIPSAPNTRSHKVQVLGDLLLVNHELLGDKYGGSADRPWKGGLSIYDISERERPKLISFWKSSGTGVHRMAFWEEPYAYISVNEQGFERRFVMVLDLSDPAKPEPVGSWWVPGQKDGEPRDWNPAGRKANQDGKRVGLHHALPAGDRLYCGWWDHGLVVLDISDPTNPTFVSDTDFDGGAVNTHTTAPVADRKLVLTSDERTADGPQQVPHHARVVDVSDERNPRTVARFPVPEGDYPTRGGRFGPHNFHEMRPGSLQDSDTAFLTYFNAGLRVFDLTTPSEPVEIAHFVPPPTGPGQEHIQLNDVMADDDGLIYVSDRAGSGVFILTLDDAADRLRNRP